MDDLQVKDNEVVNNSGATERRSVEKVPEKAEKRHVLSKVYQSYAIYSSVKALPFSFISSQDVSFGVLTSLGLLATQRHYLTAPSNLKPLCPPTSEVVK